MRGEGGVGGVSQLVSCARVRACHRWRHSYTEDVATTERSLLRLVMDGCCSVRIESHRQEMRLFPEVDSKMEKEMRSKCRTGCATLLTSTSFFFISLSRNVVCG